jgi:hypothetical protein
MLMHLVAGKFVTQALAAAAELNLAEQLVDGPRTAQEIAGPMGVHAPSLYRLMRALAAVGVLTQEDGDRFALTAVGQLLRSDAPGSFRAMAMLLGRQWHHTAWASLAHSVRTGESAFIKVYGVPHFEWLQANPEEGAIFNEAMTSLTGVAAGAVTQAYEFSGVARNRGRGRGPRSLSLEDSEGQPARERHPLRPAARRRGSREVVGRRRADRALPSPVR